jgi:hypothetical protein
MKTIDEEESEHRDISSMTNKELREEVMRLNEKVELMTKILVRDRSLLLCDTFVIFLSIILSYFKTSMHKDQEFQLKNSE